MKRVSHKSMTRRNKEHMIFLVSDPYPQLLCGACATSIQSFHLLIEKAIQSERIFQSRWQVSIEIIEDTQNGDFSTDEDEVGPTESVYVMENEESLADLKSETGDNEMWQYEKVEAEPSDCDVKNENPAKKRKTSLEENSCESNSNSFAEDHKTLEGDEEKVSSEEKTEIGKAKTYKTAMCSYCCKIVYILCSKRY